MRPLLPMLLLAGCATTIERPVPSGTPFRVSGSNRVLDFAGAEIVGKGAHPDEFEGTAILIEGGRDITIRNARIRGFKVAIHAIGVQRLTIENCDLSGNWRQRLNSTVDAEAPEDWLYGHRNDDNEWLRYGAAVYLDRCPDATIRNTVGRDGQNGICITRSDRARIYDNDFSFNSGWGLAMYRSSRCVVSRNKFDWCIRGYSHEVYSRGQDSTGILVYEQCNDNVFAYNSATHGGDGFFLWAGHETLDKTGEGGCNFNLLYRNDFSHAAANGIEATFSVGNRFIENRIEECDHGIWAGYSSETEIRGNYIAHNQNGISIEHGQWNSIVANTFEGNGTAVNLWWDRDEDLFKTAFGSKRNLKSENYLITDNTFRNDTTILKVRESSWVVIAKNNFVKSSRVFDFDPATDTFAVQDNNFGDFEKPPELGLHIGANWWKRPPPGAQLLDHPAETRTPKSEAPPILGSLDTFLPGGALRGRKHIFVDEWGPRRPNDPTVAEERKKQAVNLATNWKVAFHAWEPAGAGKPPADWEAVKASPPVELEHADMLDYRWPGRPTKDVPADYFATIATTEVELEAGEYELRTISDDGIRVAVDDRVVIDDWTWHPPKTHSATLTLSKGKHAIRVEHFEIDGYAELSVRLRPSR